MANVIPTIKSDDIDATLDGIAGSFDPKTLTTNGNITSDFSLRLAGEVLDIAGVLNSDAVYTVHRLEEVRGLSSFGEWGYYAKQVANVSSQWFKAWVRWNLAEAVYDYYLEADAHEAFSHATPYAGDVH